MADEGLAIAETEQKSESVQMDTPDTPAETPGVEADPAQTEQAGDDPYADGRKIKHEKYGTVGELLKALDGAQKKLSERPELAAHLESMGSIQNAEDFIAKTGFTNEELVKYRAENDGKLGDEHYKAFAEKAGIPPVMVDAFLAGEDAKGAIRLRKVQAREDAKVKAAGGLEMARAAIEWAKSDAGLKPEERKFYGDRLDNLDPDIAGTAMGELRARYLAHLGSSSDGPIKGTPQGGLRPFATTEEARNYVRQRQQGKRTAEGDARLRITPDSIVQGRS